MDAYERKARLAPAALAAAPSAALLIAAVGYTDIAETSLAALILGSLGILICAGVRDRGRTIEPELWESWGGPPAQRLLSQVDSNDLIATERLRAHVEAMVGWQLPTAADEKADPRASAQHFDEAVRFVIQRVRHNGFPLVDKENAEYGFRRNMLGLRPVALALAALIGVASAVLLATDGRPAFIPVLVVSFLGAVMWKWAIHGDWVRLAADRYAKQLTEAIMVLQP